MPFYTHAPGEVARKHPEPRKTKHLRNEETTCRMTAVTARLFTRGRGTHSHVARGRCHVEIELANRISFYLCAYLSILESLTNQ